MKALEILAIWYLIGSSPFIWRAHVIVVRHMRSKRAPKLMPEHGP